MINQNSELSFSNRSASKLVKIDQFTYGLENCSTGTIIDNFGNESEAESNMQPFSSEAYDPTTWEEVIMDVSDVYEDYTLVSQNNLESFISYDDSYVIRYTGSYACAISALINCADYYGVLNYSDFAGDYETLWDLSGTSTEYRNGIAYGSTNIYDIGPAFVYFCQNRGVSIRENTVSFPDYNFFKTCIDDGDMALLHAGIFDANDQERSGHTMTQEKQFIH